MLHWCDLAILSETDIDFMMGLLPQDEVLWFPLPSWRVGFEQFPMHHCGGAPITEGA